MSMASTRCNYDLIAIDLDGTLLGDDHAISPANLRSIARALDSGVRVSVCTGRGYNECKRYVRAVGHVDPVIVAGGAIVADAQDGRTIQSFTMRPDLVRRLVDAMLTHDHAVLLLKDAGAIAGPEGGGAMTSAGVVPGHDYVIVSPRGEAGVDPVSLWWFRSHGIRVRIVPSLDHDEHPEHTVRVGVCGTRGETNAAARTMREGFVGEVTLHHFGAVAPGDAARNSDDQMVILEAFDRDVNKWSAIRWLAQRDGIDLGRVAAIGNDVNDVHMLEHAGLGVAMGNAIPECLAIADRTTRAHTDDGVAHAIDRILSGEW